MSKLGYTFYPQNWQTDDDVFDLNLTQRGLYREIIDLAMTNDNVVIFKYSTWARKFNISEDNLKELITQLIEATVIVLKEENQIFVPSCEKRLVFVRSGKKGGKNKGTLKGSTKPLAKPLRKPIANQEEGEGEEESKEEKEIEIKPPVKKSPAKHFDSDLDERLDAITNVDTSKFSDTMGFNAIAYQYFIKNLPHYVCTTHNEIDQLKHIKNAIWRSIKAKAPDGYKINDKICSEVWFQVVDHIKNHKYFKKLNLQGIANKLSEIMTEIRESKTEASKYNMTDEAYDKHKVANRGKTYAKAVAKLGLT